MSRFSDTALLIAQSFIEDSIGQDVPVESTREVFVNPYTMGSDDYFNAAQAGLRPEAELQLRTDEYHGEHYLEFKGDRLKVFRVMDQGEYTRLICERVNADV